MKTCTKCGNEHPATAEYFYKHNQKKDGLRPDCKFCTDTIQKKYRQSKQGIKTHLKASNKYEKTVKGRIANKKYRRTEKFKLANRKAVKKYHQKKRLEICGLTMIQSKQIYLSQNMCCAICKQSVSYDEINFDHNHDTNKFRGLLCQKCNRGLGLFNDNIHFLTNAITYLEKNG